MKPVPLRKIVASSLPPAILHRERLITQLNDIVASKRFPSKESITNYKLVLLCAPVGYGKTTLLIDFAQHTSVSCCWYFLDQSDTDSSTFLSNLLASIRHRFPQFGVELDALLPHNASANTYSDTNQSFKIFLDALIAALDTEISEPFLFLLCNYHEVDGSPTITHFVNQLLQKLPSHCLLIIESRSTPSIEFASLLAHHQAIGWGSNALRVSAQEIQDLARIQGVTPLSRTEAEQLATAFDGWIAGILLGTRLGDTGLLQTGTRTCMLQGFPSLRIEREKLFAYLVKEIFNRHPSIYAFLKEAAVLEQMTPALCNDLLSITDASVHLEDLVRQGMFVSYSDDGPQPVYICHPVLRELLCDELRRTVPVRFSELHRRATQLFDDAHEYEKAITHALVANDNNHAAQLIIQAYQQMQGRQHAETLLRWINALPSEVTEQYPQLLLIQASIHLMYNNYPQALPLLDSARALQTTRSFPALASADVSRLQVEIMILRSKALFQEGKYQEGQHVCQQVLEAIPMDEVTQRAEAHTYFGLCTTLLGDIITGIEHLQKALQLWGRNTVRFQTAEANSALANNYDTIGNFALAEHHLSRSIRFWEQLHDDKGKASNLLRMGNYKHRQGAFDEAVSILTQVLTMAQEHSGFEREEAYTLDSLGMVYQDKGLYSQSLQVLEQALDLARQLGDHYLINGCLCNLSLTYLLMGDAATALLLLSETNLPPRYDENIGHEQTVHDLVYGLILLHQRRYQEAAPLLISLVDSLQKANFKFELLRARLSLAACHIACSKQREAVACLEEVAAILESHDYGQITVMRLKRFPEVYRLIRTQPTLARLRTLLQIEPAAQELQTSTPSRTASVPQPAASNQTRIKIQAFGEPSVFLDERAITRWRMARSMELFFYLLDCGRPMRKEQIITALWPEVDEQISQTFHSTVHYLRKALVDAAIVSRGGTYSLNLSALSANQEVQYDVALFKQHYTRAKQLLDSEDDEEAKEALLAMVQLYQGDYVQPFYSDWCTFQRDELRRMYVDARNHLAHIAWQQEEFDESALHWQHMLAIDNCLEEAHYGLIKYYMKTGKRGSALRQYQRCAEILQEELGARPGAAIQSLYQRLNGSSEVGKKSEHPSRQTLQRG